MGRVVGLLSCDAQAHSREDRSWWRRARRLGLVQGSAPDHAEPEHLRLSVMCGREVSVINLNEWRDKAFNNSKAHGFWDGVDTGTC